MSAGLGLSFAALGSATAALVYALYAYKRVKKLSTWDKVLCEHMEEATGKGLRGGGR